MEAAVTHSCAIFLEQNIWLDGFCSVVFYYEILNLKNGEEKENQTQQLLPTKLVLEKDLNLLNE